MLTSIKILRIIPTLNPASGGPAQHIKLITPYLNKLNIETTVVSLDEPTDSFLENLSFKIIPLGKPTTPWQYNKKLYQKLQELITEFDLVIQHGLWLYHGYAIKRALKNVSYPSKTPLFIYPHGMLDPYYQVEKKRWLKALRNKLYFWLIEKDIIENANVLIFTSELELMSHEASFGKINGPQKVNLGYTSQAIEKSHVQRNTNLLFIGRIDPKKGLDELVKAWLKFKTTTQNSHKLIIAGPGWESNYVKALRKTIVANEVLNENIVILGQQNQQQMQGLLNSSKASVLWSKHENFAQSISESLSVGTPVLISRGVNIYADIATQQAGLVGNPDWEGAYNSITKLYALTELEYQNYSHNAKNLYQQHFHPTLYAMRLKTFIQAWSESNT